jgi:hypothetical protein
MPRNSLETKTIHRTHRFGSGGQAACSDECVALGRLGLAQPSAMHRARTKGVRPVLETVQWTLSGSNGRSPGGDWIFAGHLNNQPRTNRGAGAKSARPVGAVRALHIL